MARIQLDHTIRDVINNMSDGVPGAIRVLVDLFQQTPAIDKLNAMKGYGPIMALDSIGVYGSQIWILYKDVCRESLPHMVAVFRAWQLGLLSEADIKTGNFSPAKILEQVIAQLGAENFITPTYT